MIDQSPLGQDPGAATYVEVDYHKLSSVATKMDEHRSVLEQVRLHDGTDALRNTRYCIDFFLLPAIVTLNNRFMFCWQNLNSISRKIRLHEDAS